MYPSLVPAMTDREIIARFPTLFDTDGDFTTTAMHRGFENVGKGWLGIMDRLCARLLPIAPQDFRILAVKSKYGTLRIAYRGGDDAVEAVIEAAKAEALLIRQ
jgi:hypothetical protein